VASPVSPARCRAYEECRPAAPIIALLRPRGKVGLVDGMERCDSVNSVRLQDGRRRQLDAWCLSRRVFRVQLCCMPNLTAAWSTLLLTVVSVSLAAQRAPRRPAGESLAGKAPSIWTLQWRDEFDGPRDARPDTLVWTAQRGDGCDRGICGWGNSERQTYTDATENASLTGEGQLAITARVASASQTCWYGPCRYTSARLVTKGRVEPTYGRVEARIRVPAGQGLWPAFWLLGAGHPDIPWPACGELDIMEFRGSTPMETSSAIHGPGYSGNTPFSNRYRPGGDFSRGYHLFAVEWSRDSVVFTVDATAHYAVDRAAIEAKGRWAFDGGFQILLNLAVGGGFDGDPASDAVLPATMLVDYVRVYSKASRRRAASDVRHATGW